MSLEEKALGRRQTGGADRAKKPWEETLPTLVVEGVGGSGWRLGGGGGVDASLVPYAMCVACLVGTMRPRSYKGVYKGPGVWG